MIVLEHDMGEVAYASEYVAVDVSLPHILDIEYLPAIPQSQLINLFNPYKNLRKINYGNPFSVKVKYSDGIVLAPAASFSYGQLLSSLLNIPIQVGTTRIMTRTQAQAREPLYWLRSVGVGDYKGQSMYPLNYANQYIRNITYLQDCYQIDGFTQLSYLQRPADTSVLLYFYSSRNVDQTRAFSNEKVVQRYASPQMEFNNIVGVV
jgi:hypothetical protein